MDIIFINHEKSQCGVYEIGKRIYELFDKKILDVKYFEVPIHGIDNYRFIIETEKPKYIIYNYYPQTLAFLSKNIINSYSNIKHIGIIHDPLDPYHINLFDTLFDAWIIHDTTNNIESSKKFKTVRPIRRFIKKEIDNKILNIGSHGFSVSPWKMFDKIIEQINKDFDSVNINMNITQATFGGTNDTDKFNAWKQIITKSNINLNITNYYYNSEYEVIDFLAKNDLNVYFYTAPSPYVGVGGSADLAISSQSSLVVNNTHMYRHIHEYLGFFDSTNNLNDFLKNKNIVKSMYDDWHPEIMTIDYKKMIESV
jgi:hypothetical protein